MTTASLSATKTAVGKITFNLESPAISLDSGLKFYYTDNEMTYGSTTEKGVSLSSVPYKLLIDSENLLSSYYVRVVLEFMDDSGNELSDISFSNFSATFSDNTAMSTPVYNAELGGYCSISSAKVAKGSEIDLMEYLKSIVPNETSFDLSIVITADKSADFSSVNRSQITIKASVGVFYTVFTLGSGFDGLIMTYDDVADSRIRTRSCNLSNQNNLTLQNNSGNAYYLKLEIPLGNTFVNTGDYVYEYKSTNKDDFENDTANGILKYWTSDYRYTLTNDSNGHTTITMEVLNKVTTSSIDLVHLLKNSGDVTFCLTGEPQFTNENQEIKFYYSNNGSFYNYWDSKIIKLVVYSFACITGDTQIKIQNGYILAKDLKIGDIVLSLNEQTGEIENTTVTKVLETQSSVIYTINFEDGTYLNITGSHPMLTERGWVCAESTSGNPHNVTVETVALKLGDNVKTENGWKQVVSITQKYNSETLYNISVDNNHNYFANDVLLHNKAT